MIKNIITIAFISISFFGFSQKKELRSAQKLLDQSFFNEALDVLSGIDNLIPSSDKKIQAQYYLSLIHI